MEVVKLVSSRRCPFLIYLVAVPSCLLQTPTFIASLRVLHLPLILSFIVELAFVLHHALNSHALLLLSPRDRVGGVLKPRCVQLHWVRAISSTRTQLTDTPSGSLYFIAHPADSLLYQNPDLFHDLYVYKCVTTVVFTSGDRGIVGNHSRSLEHGVEAAYSWMSGLATEWSTDMVEIWDHGVQLSSHRDAANVQIMYLRLPDGAPAGQGYGANDGESLRKLYNGDIETITAVDGNATYTLESLKDLLAALLRASNATDVRVLDYKTGIPDDEDARSDHADHVVSARLVVEVMKREKSKAKLRG